MTVCSRCHDADAYKTTGYCKPCKALYNKEYGSRTGWAGSSRWRKANPEKRRVIVAEYNVTHRTTTRKATRQSRKGRLRGALGTFTSAEWRALATKYANRCLCCGQQEPDISLTADHVIPVSKGGSNTIDNIQPLCGPCNFRKATKDTDYRGI